MQLRVSSKKQAKIKLALQGCAGSGKTYSALLLAYGLCGDWSKIAIIDSENGSADYMLTWAIIVFFLFKTTLPLRLIWKPLGYVKMLGWKSLS